MKYKVGDKVKIRTEQILNMVRLRSLTKCVLYADKL